MTYIYQNPHWPNFTWDQERISVPLAAVRHRQGRFMGRMEGLGFPLRTEAMLQTLTLDILKTSEIEGKHLDHRQIRSSLARRLGITITESVPSARAVDGIVEMMCDATQNFFKPLSQERLFGWHAALFPTGYSDMHKIIVGAWREGPMQVVSGSYGHERVHYQAPDATVLKEEVNRFLRWFNSSLPIDPVFKAAIAHLWFVTIHPFEDGNGRIARAIADLQLARADNSALRFYSMSAQIQQERKIYYDILENTQKGSLDITEWMEWFIACFDRALEKTEQILKNVMRKARFWEAFATVSINDRQRLMINKLLDGFEGKMTSSKWAKISKCSHDTALRDIQHLVDLSILSKDSAGGRSTSYSLCSFKE